MSFQDFTTASAAEVGAARVTALREALRTAGVQGFVVPRADAHQGEQVAPCDARLQWLTGFSGSAGLAVVTLDRAAIFVDGRYTLQAESQTDPQVFERRALPRDKPEDWAAQALPEGAVLAYDPWLMTAAELSRWQARMSRAGIALRAVANPIDTIWEGRPPRPRAPMAVHPETLAGRSHADKRAEVADTLRTEGVSAAVLTLPASICWLLNVRGGDLPRLPVAQGFAILDADGRVALFTDPDKVTAEVRAHLGDAVEVHPQAEFGPGLRALSGRVGVDRDSAPVRVQGEVEAGGAEVHWMRDPCLLPKACKTEAELDGARAAHLRDGAAVVEFLAWLDAEAPKGELTEIDVVRALESRRRAGGALLDIAFDTIAGAGPDGAIVHYRVSEATNRRVAPGELLLIDSGGQYRDGTTDITRTVATGPVDPEARRAFTLVLKGMIAISTARWPAGVSGRELDALARIALWRAGLDYDHGTGHGVGSFLDVHEGPQAISRRNGEPLRPGMILSNEPGYYRAGAFGIRIENLVAVRPAEVPEGGEREMLSLETLTLAPIDRALVEADLLTAAERAWLDAYHARVRDALSPHLGEAARRWLAAATEPLHGPATGA